MNEEKSKNEPPRARWPEGMVLFFIPGREDEISETPLEYYPEHAALIAYIVAEWTQIEFKMGIWFANCLEANRNVIAPMLQSIVSSRARLGAVSSALRQVFDNDQTTKVPLERILRETSELLSQRNRYAHAHYGSSALGELAMAVDQGRETPIIVPLEQLRSDLQRMKKLSHELGLIIATQLMIPIRGPEAPKSVPNHPLGMRGTRQKMETINLENVIRRAGLSPPDQSTIE